MEFSWLVGAQVPHRPCYSRHGEASVSALCILCIGETSDTLCSAHGSGAVYECDYIPLNIPIFLIPITIWHSWCKTHGRSSGKPKQRWSRISERANALHFVWLWGGVSLASCSRGDIGLSWTSSATKISHKSNLNVKHYIHCIEAIISTPK